MQFKDWLPLIAILGPITAALITLAATRYFRERKRLSFYVQRTEDLTRPLLQQFPIVVFKLGGHEVLNLNRATIIVRNTGNSTLKDITFDVEIPGHHPMHIANQVADSHKLTEEVSINWLQRGSADYHPTFSVSIKYLNPKEMFWVQTFFDGTSDDIKVHCRMEGVTAQIRDGDFKNVSDLAMQAIAEIAKRSAQGVLRI